MAQILLYCSGSYLGSSQANQTRTTLHDQSSQKPIFHYKTKHNKNLTKYAIRIQ